MTVRSSPDTEARAVRALARETAAVPVPPLDWDAIEKKLLAKVVAEVKNSSPATRSASPSSAAAIRVGTPWAVALAAAAVVALVAGASVTRARRASTDV